MENFEQNTPGRLWYVNIDGTVHEASAETVDKWIWDGTILSHHTVSRGGVRWLEARKVPQFAQHFSPETNAAVETEVEPRLVEARSASYTATQIPDQDDTAASTGLKISLGSAIALAAALLGGYLWAFHFSSPPARASLVDTPEMQKLQNKYTVDRKRLDEIQASQKQGRELSAQKLIYSTGKGLEIADNWRPDSQAGIEKINAARPGPPQLDADGTPVIDVAKSMETLDLKFDADQKQTIADLQKASARSVFYKTFVLLFLGLAGLNILGITILSKRQDTRSA